LAFVLEVADAGVEQDDMPDRQRHVRRLGTDFLLPGAPGLRLRRREEEPGRTRQQQGAAGTRGENPFLAHSTLVKEAVVGLGTCPGTAYSLTKERGLGSPLARRRASANASTRG